MVDAESGRTLAESIRNHFELGQRCGRTFPAKTRVLSAKYVNIANQIRSVLAMQSYTLRAFIVFMLTLLALPSFAWVSEHKQAQEGLAQQLKLDQQQLDGYRQKQKRLLKVKQSKWDSVDAHSINKNVVDRQQLALIEAQSDLTNARQVLADVAQKYSDLRRSLDAQVEKLQDHKIGSRRTEAEVRAVELQQEHITYLTALVDLTQRRINLWRDSETVLQQIVTTEQEIYQHITQLYFQEQDAQREHALVQLEARVQVKRQQWLTALEQLNTELASYDPSERYTNAKAIILSLQHYQLTEQIFLAELELRLERINDQVHDLGEIPGRHLSVPELDTQIQNANAVKITIKHLRDRIKAKLAYLSNKKEILNQAKQQNLISEDIYDKQLKQMEELTRRYDFHDNTLARDSEYLQVNHQRVSHELTKTLASRQVIPGFNVEAWYLLWQKVKHIPSAAVRLVVALGEHTSLALTLMPSSRLLGLIMMELGLLVAAVVIFIYSKVGLAMLATRRHLLSGNLAFGAVTLIRRNAWSISLFIGLLLFFITLGIPAKSYIFIIYLMLVWFSVRTLIGTARLILMETMSDASGHDVELYHRLKWLFSVGGLIVAVTVLLQQLHVAYEVSDIINRIFMVFVLLSSIVLFRRRHVLPSLIGDVVDDRRNYLHRAISLLSSLVPISLFVNAFVGMIGYIQLAWVIGYYQAILLIAMFGYVIARGLVIDLMEWLADLAVKYLTAGWLWRQALLKPFDRLMRLLVFLITLAWVFIAFGLDSNSSVVIKLSTILHHEIVSFSGGDSITTLSLLQFSILLTMLVWAARWMREIGYRYIFADLHDQSLRNSLSIFTQYAVVILGGLFTLRVLGIGISGFAYIFGGLAFGLGLGLRDFANNIVSGMMLLIERPVREGDLVSVAEHEGRVTNIGLRSMTIRSWDNLEVLIPNSETFNKSFTNWTRQDSIVRTVIPIKIHRADDPIQVQTIILKVLADLPAVLEQPEPQVFLREIDDALIEFQVRYFINLQDVTRVAVRSLVLFSIWERFKAAGIRAPYPQQDIRLIESPH